MAQMKGTTVGYYYYSIKMQVCVEQHELVSINANSTRTVSIIENFSRISPGPMSINKNMCIITVTLPGPVSVNQNLGA